MKPKECPNCKSEDWNKSEKKVTKDEIGALVRKIKEVHVKIISVSGGEQGIRDEGGLFHSTYSILNYIEKHAENPAAIGAYIFAEFARKHHFMDGNKRTSYVLAKTTMLSYKCNFDISYKEAIPFIVCIAEHESKVTLEEIRKWIENQSKIIEEKDIENYINSVFNELI